MIGPANARIQSLSIDLLQTIIARGDMGLQALESIENIVVAKIFSSIHTGRLDLQPKLLHILHSVILATSTIPQARQGKSKADAALAVAALEPSGSVASNVIDEGVTRKLPSSSIDPLLTQTLIHGISEISNRPILQHWLDFILTTVPQFSQSLQQLSYPLSECICRQLNSSLGLMEEVLLKGFSVRPDSAPIMTDSEFVMLLHALERLVLQGLSKGETSYNENPDDALPTTATEKESTGLLGLVSNVFTPDGSGSFPIDSLSVSLRSTSDLKTHTRESRLGRQLIVPSMMPFRLFTLYGLPQLGSRQIHLDLRKIQ